MPVLFLVIVEHEACNMGGNAARIEIKRMGSGLRDGFGPPAAPWLAFPAPFRRRSMSRSGVTSRSALPHSGPSRLGGHSRLRKPTSTSIRAISNFGTGKSRTCARLGCLRIERWAREGIARANVAFPPNCNVHRRDRERQLYVDSSRTHCASTGHSPNACEPVKSTLCRPSRSAPVRAENARRRT